MSCAPIDTEAPRFYVSIIEGFPIHPGGGASTSKHGVLVATVIDRCYGSAHGRFASSDPKPRRERCHDSDPEYGSLCACGGKKSKRRWTCSKCANSSPYLGFDGALAAAAERCAELNAWDEREGDGEYVPLAAGRA